LAEQQLRDLNLFGLKMTKKFGCDTAAHTVLKIVIWFYILHVKAENIKRFYCNCPLYNVFLYTN